MIIRILFTLLVVAFSACATQPPVLTAVSADSLLGKLRQGGYVIYFRHAATNHSQKDSDLSDFSNCDEQRNLDHKGRNQSELIGEQFKQLGIPVGRIKTSKMCRCIDTAELAFGRADPIQDLTSIVGVSTEVRQQRVDAIKAMLGTEPDPGTNTILVSHKHMFHDASGVWLEEGEAAIYKPESNSKFKLMKKIKPADWQGLIN